MVDLGLFPLFCSSFLIFYNMPSDIFKELKLSTFSKLERNMNKTVAKTHFTFG